MLSLRNKTKHGRMKTISVQEPINLKVVRFELDFTTLAPTQQRSEKIPTQIRLPKAIRENHKKQGFALPPPIIRSVQNQKRDVKNLVEELLDELYADQRDWSSNSGAIYGYGSMSAASISSTQSNYGEQTDAIERNYLEDLDLNELRQSVLEQQKRLQVAGEQLARCVRSRDRLRRQQKRLCAALTVLLRHIIWELACRFPAL